MDDLAILTSAQWSAFYRAAHSPDRILVGQLGCTHRVAEQIVAAGLWENTHKELFHGKLHQRYRYTQAGLERLVSVQATDITVRNRTESEQNVGEIGYKHE